jgi:hypothetical protein
MPILIGPDASSDGVAPPLLLQAERVKAVRDATATAAANGENLDVIVAPNFDTDVCR